MGAKRHMQKRRTQTTILKKLTTSHWTQKNAYITAENIFRSSRKKKLRKSFPWKTREFDWPMGWKVFWWATHSQNMNKHGFIFFTPVSAAVEGRRKKNANHNTYMGSDILQNDVENEIQEINDTIQMPMPMKTESLQRTISPKNSTVARKPQKSSSDAGHDPKKKTWNTSSKM